MPTAEILSQGDEVVTGQVADTNAAWLSTRLTDLGFDVQRHTSVGDRLDDLCAVLGEIAPRCDLCICTGGLGPTEDDLTAEAVARTFDLPLVFDEEAMAQITALYARFGRDMPEVNRKQAWLPTGARRLDNHWGTAPGFAVDTAQSPRLRAPGQAWMFFVPGVPREMRKMFDQRIVPLLGERFPVEAGRLVTLRTTGIGESNLQERIAPFDFAHTVLSFRTKLPENHVKLRFSASASDGHVREVTLAVATRIGSPLFTVEGLPEGTLALPEHLDRQGGDLATVVGRTLGARGETVATAESCTGGRVAAMLTSVPGASSWFTEGAITYSNAAKIRLLGVDPDTLATQGAVSEAVARQMAEGVRARAGTTYGLATTGIAGPGGGTETKPVGTVHIAVATPSHTAHRLLRLGGTRERVQSLSAAAVLDSLRRLLADPANPAPLT